jgi:hypothetical protein
MHDRTALGAADVPDDVLAGIVADALGDPEAELLSSRADAVPYDLPALTTAGRFWVRGQARTAGGERPYCLFVKVVQSWSRSAFFQFVPEEHREIALAGLPWEIEPSVYASDLGAVLPPGLTMPRAYAVREVDELSAALWLEAVDHVDEPWKVERFSEAARLLGRLAASPDVRPLADVGRGPQQQIVRDYAEGRLRHQVVPALEDDGLWRHPLVAGAFSPELRGRLRSAARRLDDVVAELESVPEMTVHGDACSRNLLVRRDGAGFSLIDFGFWSKGPVGFDLGQLLIGEVQTGERPACQLPELETACVAAYVEGLREEGADVPLAVVQRAHALQALLFAGLSSLPLEQLGAPPTPELQRVAGERAQLATFLLDLVDATG